MTFNDLNLKFYDALNQIFKINKYQTWSELASGITLDKISETYKIYSEIFPLNLNRIDLLPKNDPKEKLSVLFHGSLDGLSIINNIARYSIYSDEIIVFHPLQNPANTSDEYNPIKNPHLWKRDFVNSLYFYIVLSKWVKSGIVHLIQNPFNYNEKDHKFFIDLAEKRVSSHENELNTPELLKEHEEIMFNKFKTALLGMPISVIENSLRKIYPNYNDNQIKFHALGIKELEKQLPLYVDFGSDIPNGELMINKSGANIEMVEALCKLTGSHSYTTENFVRKQLELKGSNSYWTKFGIIYSGLPLTYIDKVDTSFALRIRQEDRINGVRKVLREISSFLEQNDLDKISDDKILTINDRITTEIKKSETEWQKIYDDSTKANIASMVGTSVISLLIDPTKFIVPALNVPATIAITEYFKSRNLKSYRAKDPYSVFVDLKNKKPSFFSELRNCIF